MFKRFIRWVFGDPRVVMCCYRHMNELSKWPSRQRGPEHYGHWKAQLDMFIGDGDNKYARYINYSVALDFIRKLNDVEIEDVD